MPAVGHGQFPKHWDGIRGGRKVGFSVPTSNLTLKKGLGKQKIKKKNVPCIYWVPYHWHRPPHIDQSNPPQTYMLPPSARGP